MSTKRKTPRSAGRSAPRRTKAGRERMQLLVDPALLAAAGAALGTTTKSDAVNAALRNAAENAAILRGMEESVGTIPDFPYLDT